MRHFAAFSTLALVAALPLAAKADTFTITGNAQTITFDLPANPTPDSFQLGAGFLFNNVTVMDNGITLNTGVGFGNADGGFPDLFIGDNQAIISAPIVGTLIPAGDPSYGYFFGNTLYTGTEDNPTFALGSYSLLNSVGPTSSGTPAGFYTLTIADNTTAVTPEPSSLLLLGSGLVGLAGAVRRRLA